MDVETVECPVCDQKIPVDAVRCPNCNAVFSLSDVEELKHLARELNDPATADRPRPVEQAPAQPEEARAEKRTGLFGKLFGKKK